MNKKKFIIICAIIILFLILGVGIILVSYGYVTSDIIDKDGKGKYYIVENLRIEYSDNTEELISNEGIFIPGSTITKTFKIKNTGSKDINYNIVLTDIKNTFNRKKDITYELYLEDIIISSGMYPDEQISYIVGDVNLDGIIDELDYKKMQSFIKNTINLTRLEMIAADLNFDNIIDNLDSPSLIKEYIDSINQPDINQTNTNIGLVKTTKNIETILDNQFLKVNESKTFTLKINYLTSNENQIEDNGKVINAKISFEQSN